ncbi:ABC transporter permease [Aquabacterium sp. OR-4]|uniref:ABC transporter permease n=1 Tax=Aquabacterium sp. OR-4 TaxID=2978127 RepID=UPI0028C79115|nr:ABC transporter permease [Aquabacterium sp. OR-4]MDT7835109.1 ABC transporter permease [Aquabacterium sp. OR-4]
MWRHLFALIRAEWRHHPWRHAVALLAVALGVALASSVQLINASALAEFSQAVRAANGQPDAVLAARTREGFDDALYARLALDESVALASPVLELDAATRRTPDAAPITLRLLGLDPVKAVSIAPALLPRPAETSADGSKSARAAAPGEAPGNDNADEPAQARALTPAADALYLNPAAAQALGVSPGATLWLATAQGWQPFRFAGRVTAGGAALAVLDIAAAQSRFGRAGRLSRIDVRLVAGVAPGPWQQAVAAAQALPAGVTWAQADDAVQRVSNLSRAYRVNLGVLALVALLVGGFLVYSVVSLSVAQRTPQFALLGVLGLAARDRRALVLAESAAIGLAGSLLGLAAGIGLAALALRLLGGDLGGGYFPGVTPALAWPVPELCACFTLGIAAALAGAWWPARQAEALAPAVALKGLGAGAPRPARAAPALLLLGLGGALALAPPVGGLPLAAYAAVAALLAGGVVAVPWVVQQLLARPPRWLTGQGAVPLLAWRRAHFARQTAGATVAGVVASLALSVAITVMVASFRDAVTDWLDSVLPADLYLRAQAGGERAVLPPALVAAAARVPGVLRVQAGRQVPLLISPAQPAVALVARPLGDDPARALPLVGQSVPAAPGALAVWVSEPAAALHGWQPGQRIVLPLAAGPATVQVRGIWRDYARQFGAIAIDLADYQRLSGDRAIGDLALWLAPGTAPATVQAALQAAAGPELPLEMIGTQELRRVSLAIFDRSFAVTVYLQAAAIGVGLIGVAASLSAQVLARRKEFGLLTHLGLTRRQMLALVAAETGAWLLAGVVVGLVLGLAMAAVLVHVVNPQSFHWTMPLQVPAARLAALATAVLAAGGLTALLAARRAAGRDAVLAVKEDW